jgi:hypothetical protein
MFPPEVLKTVAIYRLPSSGNKVYPGSATSTVTAAFLPLDRKNHALEGGVYNNPHELYLDPAADIEVSDKVVVNSVIYFVKHKFSATFGGLPHIRVTISQDA